MCGVAPEIEFIKKPGDLSAPEDIIIDRNNSATINFLTKIDAEQKPIRQIAIDWGITGNPPQVVHLSSSDGVGLEQKNLVTDPFTYTSPPYTIAGMYQPRVMVQDNWKWCNGETNGAGCYANTDTNSQCYAGGCGNADNWLVFPARIFVNP